MAEKSVAQKLLIKPGQQVRAVNPPQDLLQLLGSLPDDTSLLTDSAAPHTLLSADVLLFFANNRTDLQTLLPGLRAALPPGGILWVAYHKGTSPVHTDINRDSINAYAKTINLQGVSMITINEDWAALRLKVIDGG